MNVERLRWGVHVTPTFLEKYQARNKIVQQALLPIGIKSAHMDQLGERSKFQFVNKFLEAREVDLLVRPHQTERAVHLNLLTNRPEFIDYELPLPPLIAVITSRFSFTSSVRNTLVWENHPANYTFAELLNFYQQHNLFPYHPAELIAALLEAVKKLHNHHIYHGLILLENTYVRADEYSNPLITLPPLGDSSLRLLDEFLGDSKEMKDFQEICDEEDNQINDLLDAAQFPL